MYVRPRYAHKSFYLSQKRYLTQMHGSHKIFDRGSHVPPVSVVWFVKSGMQG
jgi:hypothetical protein